MDPIIELVDVSFSYPKDAVLSGVSCRINKGDYVGIIGPNGGGKTTLLKIMLGLLSPATGSVQLFNQPIKKFRDWYRIGYVPQKATNFDKNFPATVKEVVLMGRFAKRGLFRSLTNIDIKKVDEVLAKVEMTVFKDRHIGDLSGGQQQRVFIARALSSDPEVIILDEPTAGVDEERQGEFYQLLRKLNHDHQLTLLLVSHDSDVIAREAQKVFQVNKVLTEK